ncbi:glycosyltransferase [Phaeacidiphilus oryzae]|uniref:glycosyltransferase n=1 Tax=Phaeacidiphilus oryzae TaxID=348818 RepID=UPI00055F668E|nr:glycosyltransferase [Phaeacidiphilus oryzae]
MNRPLVVAVSGPDGAGKSSLVARLEAALSAQGRHPDTAYCYGCFVCRRLPKRTSRRRHRGSAGSGRIVRACLTVHVLLDAAELALRMSAAVFRARWRSDRKEHAGGPGERAVVLTDRGPLDALAKFDPPPGSRTATLLTRLADRYDAVLLLDADPVRLAARDGEHTAEELADARARYRVWGKSLPSVVVLDARAAASAVEAEALRALAAARARRHVVLSIYDDAGNPHYHGGGAVVAERVARRLSEEFRMTVVTAGRRGGTRTRAGVRYRYLPVGWAGPRAGQLLYHALLPVVVRRLPHDLWLESFTPPFSTGFVPLFSSAPVVGIAQMLGGRAMAQRYHLPFGLVERFGLRCYRDVVTLNEADGAIVRRRSPGTTVHVIPNGVDPREIDGDRIGHGDHLLYLGRIDILGKGLDLLLSAYAKAATAMPLLIAGAGPAREERRLADLLADAGPRVHWLGRVEGARKQRLLEECAFLVLPSRSEAFGIAALEAMACGKPVLHFDLPGLSWMRGAGDVAVSPFDVAELAARISELASDVELRRAAGRQAYRAARRHGWEQTTGGYLALARRLLDPLGPVGPAVPAPAESEGGPRCPLIG